ncbi:hypothetical protein ES332_A05G121200v1 [Gossypium tomentosum]|uniref:Uncharacterized protein n=1 Tax=Gossypium tomentosum TaxID=34277 RepID=A0A5D2QH76_GOSTO|nr:hypothetical protein ES332_A05G121200v1 [Gossypium tomentosum]
MELVSSRNFLQEYIIVNINEFPVKLEDKITSKLFGIYYYGRWSFKHLFTKEKSLLQVKKDKPFKQGDNKRRKRKRKKPRKKIEIDNVPMIYLLKQGDQLMFVTIL